uniref:Uncharacterized protein n=1 Tax=Ananas comosus var. bracteatus TaxID=296719 RepID=A0A6V7NH63_ANACO|nr:unnamed protein product [Ananas comosus var. bracteatus]
MKPFKANLPLLVPASMQMFEYSRGRSDFGHGESTSSILQISKFQAELHRVVGFRYTVTWDHFADRIFHRSTIQAFCQTILPLDAAVPIPIDPAVFTVPKEELEEIPDTPPPSSSIPVSPSVPASEKRPTEATQSTPPPLPKRCKSVVKRPHSYSQQTESAPSADVLKKIAEDVPSVTILERRAEEISSADAPKERTEVSSSAAEQSSVSNEPIEIEMDRQLRHETRLKKRQEAKKNRTTQEKTQELPTSGAASPMPTTKGENMNVPLEESVGGARTKPHLTPEASSSVPEDPLSATLHSLSFESKF